MTQGPGGRAPPAPPAAPEPEAPTTFCALLPRMPQWKFAAPAGFLGRGPGAAAARAAGGAGSAAGGADPPPGPSGPAAGVPALAAAVLGACEPRCAAAPCPLPALSRCRTAGTRGTRGARGAAPDAAADEWIRKGSFIHKPAHGWLHPDARVQGSGVSYIVRVSAHAAGWGPTRGTASRSPSFQGAPKTPESLTSPLHLPDRPCNLRPGGPHREGAGFGVPTASRGERRGEGDRWAEGAHAQT